MKLGGLWAPNAEVFTVYQATKVQVYRETHRTALQGLIWPYDALIM